MKHFKKILLVMERGEGQENAFEYAVELLKEDQGQLTILDLPDDIPKQKKRLLGKLFSKELDEVMARDRGNYLESLVAPVRQKLTIEIKTVKGEPSHEIIQTVLDDNYDLVLKKTHKHQSFKTLLLGSTDMRLLRKCPCPVCILKPGKKPKFQRILAAVDIEPGSDDQTMDAFNLELMEIAAELASYESGELYFVHAWLIFGEKMLETSRSDNQRKKIKKWLKAQREELQIRQEIFKDNLTKLLEKKGSDTLQPQVLSVEGMADEVIPRIALEKEADVIVMGTIGRRGLSGFFMGNTAENILTQINCSVLAIKPSWFVSPVSNK